MANKLRVLDLFSGIGGFSLGLERTGGFQTVAFCEIEQFPRKVLKKHWPDVPCHKDVRELTGHEFEGIDVICGGYPCQPFSTAGKRQGADDDRHLWPEVNRLLAAIRPRWGIFENVAGHVSMGLDEVLSDLEKQGYTAQPFIIPACAVDAPHRRDRVWVLAHTKNQGTAWRKRKPGNGEDKSFGGGVEPNGGGIDAGCKNVADTKCVGREQLEQSIISGTEIQGATSPVEYSGIPSGGVRWRTEPDVGRVAHGIPRRVDRLKGLGNAVVPQIPEMIGRAILDVEHGKGE